MTRSKKTDQGEPGEPSPSELLPALDEEQQAVLPVLGRAWGRAVGDPESWTRALPVDPTVGDYPESVEPSRFGRFVRIASLSAPSDGVEALEETEEAIERPSRAATLRHRLHRTVLGHPLKSTAIAQERMRKLVALPVLSADALSSIAYGPEAMLAILVLAGTGGLRYSLPVAGAIAFLMLAVGLSYRQTIRGYPHGGGSYVVAADNLGQGYGLMAAAGLVVDYVLTVAVSVASGVAAITSALPSLTGATVPIGLGVIALLLAGNLRGVRQAGALFAAPTYAFVLAIALLVGFGLADAAGRGFRPLPAPHLAAQETAGLLLVLRAFASGSTAMTGIEAISNAVPVFQRVAWRNARTTLSWMVGLLIALFAGTVVLTHLDAVVPGHGQTVLSQLARQTYGPGFLYAFTQAATAAILLLAANTAFNGFPRVLFLLARDRYAPRMFLRMGDRLAFSNGIVVLAVTAAALFAAFGGRTDPLIPLFAVGVFLAFTMCQAGMVVHWWRERGRNWRRSLAFNAVGGVMSAAVFVTAGITKFTSGAWVAVVAIALFIVVARRVHRHYGEVERATRLHPRAIEVPRRSPDLRAPAPRRAPRKADGHATRKAASGDGGGAGGADGDGESEETPEEIHHLAVVPVAVLDLTAMRALAYAASLEQPVLALHVSPTRDEADRFGGYWRDWGDHLPLEVLVSPYRAVVAPLVDYLEALHRQRPDLTLTVVLPEIVTRHWWHAPLHNQVAPRLRRALRRLPKIVITTVPFHVPPAHRPTRTGG